MSTTEKRIGAVAVDSGLIAIGDPAYIGNPDQERLCIFAFTPGGDGLFPVYEQLDDDGHRIGFRIDVSESEGGHAEPGGNADERPEGVR